MKVRSLTLVPLFLMMFGLTAASANPSPAKAAEEFQQFWAGFRKAVLAKDQAKLLAFVQLPFETRGELDDSPTKKIDRKAFLALYPRILATGDGTAAEPSRTTEGFIRDVPDVTLQYINPRTLEQGKYWELSDVYAQVNLASMVFQRTPQGWRWVKAYLDE